MVEHYSSRKELIDRANFLWKRYGSEYRVLVDNYNYLLELKRALIKSGQMKKMPLEPIKISALREYPEIGFLDYRLESEAMHFIELLDNAEIAHIIKEIEDYADSPLTRTLRAKIYDFNHQIQHRDVKRSIYGISPEACSGKGRHSHRTQLSYTASLNINEK